MSPKLPHIFVSNYEIVDLRFIQLLVSYISANCNLHLSYTWVMSWCRSIWYKLTQNRHIRRNVIRPILFLQIVSNGGWNDESYKKFEIFLIFVPLISVLSWGGLGAFQKSNMSVWWCFWTWTMLVDHPMTYIFWKLLPWPLTMTHSTHPQYIQLVPKLKKALQVHFAFDDFIFD